MKKFLKDNFVLVLGILLPILVTVLFALATIIPGFFVDPPKYDLLFMTSNNYNQVGLRFDIVNGKIQAQYRCDTSYYCADRSNQQKVYRFNVKSRVLQEIPVSMPAIPLKATSYAAPVPIPELANLTINPATVSPDGYQFNDFRNNGGDFFAGLFYSSYKPQLSISKNGYSILIPLNTGNILFYDVKFIGWIISQGN